MNAAPMDNTMCFLEDEPSAISLSMWTPSGFALMFAVLAISALFCILVWCIYKLHKKLSLMELQIGALTKFDLPKMQEEHLDLAGEHADLKGSMEKVQVFSENLWGALVEVGGYISDHEATLSDERRNELEQKETENHEIAMQDDSSDERLLSVQRSIMRMHRRFFDMNKLHTHLWMGLVRLGGFIGSNNITGEIHSDLVDRNNEIMEEWQSHGHSNILGRRRHSTPGGSPRAMSPSDGLEEGQEFEDDDPFSGVVYGPAATEDEPEPHGTEEESMEASQIEPDVEEALDIEQESLDLAKRILFGIILLQTV